MAATISYQLLFLAFCVGGAVYINRRNFTSFIRTVFGIPMPSYLISAGLSLIMGLIFWGILNLGLLMLHR
jgi:hypothetical protein